MGTSLTEASVWSLRSRHTVSVTECEQKRGTATYPSKSSLSCSQKPLMLAQFSSLFRGFVALSVGGERASVTSPRNPSLSLPTPAAGVAQYGACCHRLETQVLTYRLSPWMEKSSSTSFPVQLLPEGFHF